jgi:hypothetical protein
LGVGKSFSSVAPSAGHGWINLPLLFELRADLQLLGERTGMPRHIEDLGWRAEEILGRAVTVETPFHAQGLCLIDNAHLIHRTVTAVTAHTPVHMDSMVEIGVVGQAVNLHPGNRLTGLPTLPNRSETRAVGKDFTCTVAVNTGLCGREIRMGGNLHKAVTVSTVHTELFNMEGVGKGNGLIGLIADSGVLRGEVIPNS